KTAYPWITREHVYEHGHVRLNFFRVLEWTGEPHPREDQAIAWQALDRPMASPMLPANAPVLASLALPHEYAITDAAGMGTAPMLAALERRLADGLKLLQLREPGLAPRLRELFTTEVLGLARRYDCKVLTKSPTEGAHGVHYTAAELTRLERRPASGLAAASCHTRAELEHAMALGLDFAVLGPVLEKAGAEPLGWERFAAIVRGTSIPVFAIGGLNGGDMQTAWRSGAHGMAMIRGAWRTP
ncbi:MAG: thiamine phosphate synthase, partial [Burkholderiales bacterium]